jgi:hypothetical protein
MAAALTRFPVSGNSGKSMDSRRAFSFSLLAFACVCPGAAQTIVSIVAPTNGARFAKTVGLELNIPLQAQVTNPGPGGNPVYFYANGDLIAVSGPQNGSATWSNVAFGTHTLMAGTVAGMPNSAPVTIHVDTNGVALVNEQSVWKYLDGGLNPGPAWFQPEADLSVWPSGLPQFGFGEQDERTMVNFLNQGNGTIYPAYYFRHAFVATNIAAYSNLVVRLLRDDGAIVYLNGQELFRDNMPAGPVDYLTYASAGAIDENVFNDHWVNPTRLVEGVNHLAVEVHNQGPHSEDISFDLRLVANLRVLPPRLTVSRTTTNVVVAWPRSYLGYRLETTLQLGTNQWDSVTNIATGASEFRSTNNIAMPARFFRLSL